MPNHDLQPMPYPAPDAAQVRAALEAAPTGLMSVDAEGRICLVNREIERMFGYGRTELLGRSIDLLVPERFRERHPHERDRYVRAPSERAMGAGRELFGRRKDGTEFPVEIGLSPTVGDQGTMVHCSVIDVSDRRQREQELEQRMAELERVHAENQTLAEMSSLLQHAVTLDEGVEIVQAYLRRLCPGVSAGIYLVPPGSPASDHLERRATSGPVDDHDHVGPQACWALRRSQPHRSHPGRGAHCHHGPAEYHQLCIPMVGHGQWLGLLTLCDPDAAAIDQRQTLARTTADQIGLALSNLQLRDELADLSVRDPLTGLFNRRYLEETLQRELARARRSGGPLCVLIADIDHFKNINDTLGHPEGDAALRAVARILTAGVRTDDVVCRFGGEEFVVVLPGMEPDLAVARAEALREEVRARAPHAVTMSIGVSAFPDHGRTAQQILTLADHALYEAKDRGRDRVVLATPPQD